MSFENTSGLNVANHYGPRDVHGANGPYTSSSNTVNYAIDLTGETSPEPAYIPENCRVVAVWTEATYTLKANDVKVGTVDLSLATSAAPVVVGEGKGGNLTIAASVNAGKVLHLTIEQFLA